MAKTSFTKTTTKYLVRTDSGHNFSLTTSANVNPQRQGLANDSTTRDDPGTLELTATGTKDERHPMTGGPIHKTTLAPAQAANTTREGRPNRLAAYEHCRTTQPRPPRDKTGATQPSNHTGRHGTVNSPAAKTHQRHTDKPRNSRSAAHTNKRPPRPPRTHAERATARSHSEHSGAPPPKRQQERARQQEAKRLPAHRHPNPGPEQQAARHATRGSAPRPHGLPKRSKGTAEPQSSENRGGTYQNYRERHREYTTERPRNDERIPQRDPTGRRDTERAERQEYTSGTRAANAIAGRRRQRSAEETSRARERGQQSGRCETESKARRSPYTKKRQRARKANERTHETRR